MAIYRIGSRGDEVKRIQARLKEIGCYQGPVDGDFGGGTASAVKAFQQSKCLSADGCIGPETWALLFDNEAMPRPAILAEALDFRCLALTGTFETNSGAPDCFCAISGDFDDQGMSFGVLQWNFGQNTLQPLLKELMDQHPEVAHNVFQDELSVVATALIAPHEELLSFVRSIQHPVKKVINEPWRGMAKALGRTVEFQRLQVKYAGRLFNQALMMCKEYGLASERAVMLMFDITVQNGSISDLVKARILAECKRLPADIDPEESEVRRLRIIANRRAEAANPRWVEDVRTRKLTIANGEGVVHGVHVDLANQYGITMKAY